MLFRRLAVVLVVLVSTILGSHRAVAQWNDTSVVSRLESIERKVDQQSSWTSPSVLVPLLGALGGWVVAILSLVSNTNAQREEKTREQLYGGLKWFEGGTQQRNIGISIVEGH